MNGLCSNYTGRMEEDDVLDDFEDEVVEEEIDEFDVEDGKKGPEAKNVQVTG